MFQVSRIKILYLIRAQIREIMVDLSFYIGLEAVANSFTGNKIFLLLQVTFFLIYISDIVRRYMLVQKIWATWYVGVSATGQASCVNPVVEGRSCTHFPTPELLLR